MRSKMAAPMDATMKSTNISISNCVNGLSVNPDNRASHELLDAEKHFQDGRLPPDLFKIVGPQTKTCGEKVTFKPPPSSVLERARAFLPLMAEANNTLQQQLENLPPGAVDIENVEDTATHIEMNIALVEREDSDSESDEISSDDSDTDCQCDNDADSDDTELARQTPLFGEVTERNLRLSKPASHYNEGKAKIQILENSSELSEKKT